MIELFLILVVIHWGWATGNILAVRTDWSITKFLVLVLSIWTLTPYLVFKSCVIASTSGCRLPILDIF